MKLIADSGSTKTDWRLIYNDGTEDKAETEGYNPYFKSSEEIVQSIRKQMNFRSGNHFGAINEVFFYGAGCSAKEKVEVLKTALEEVFPKAKIIVNHDLLAAARALCGKEPGLAAILGTGSNTCYFDGEQIIENIASLGFILGDEGSGANIGKRLVQDYLNKEMPQFLANRFKDEFGLDKDDILHKIYREPLPNRFLASFSRWVGDNIAEDYSIQLVEECMDQFFVKHILKYKNHNKLPLHVVGSVGYYFKDILSNLAAKHGVTMGNIYKTPMDGLVRFHQD